jgi:hypothetical protein
MAHVISSVASFRVDDSAAAIATISGSVNSVSVEGGQDLVEDTGLGDSSRTTVRGLGNATVINVNGYLDSTTEAIFTPVLSGTSLTKTIGIGLVSGQFLNGEAWPTAVNVGSNMGEISTWSCTFTAQAGLTRTSVAAA